MLVFVIRLGGSEKKGRHEKPFSYPHYKEKHNLAPKLCFKGTTPSKKRSKIKDDIITGHLGAIYQVMRRDGYRNAITRISLLHTHPGKNIFLSPKPI